MWYLEITHLGPSLEIMFQNEIHIQADCTELPLYFGLLGIFVTDQVESKYLARWNDASLIVRVWNDRKLKVGWNII